MLPLSLVGDLNAAFSAVYGADPPVAEEVRTPGGPAETLAAAPVALVPVGGGRFALIIREANGLLAHSATGAASIAYVERSPPGARAPWRVAGRWPQIAFDGEDGGQGMTLKVRLDLGPRPLVFMDAPTLFTGDSENDVVVIRLDPEKPVPIGRISLQSSDDDVLDSRFDRHRYSGRVVAAKAPALFAVRYEGWRSEAGSDVQHQFRGVVAFGLSQDCLAALGPTPAPEIKPSYTLPDDCRGSMPKPSAPAPPPLGTAARTGQAPAVRG
jgi:hypothetical protein